MKHSESIIDKNSIPQAFLKTISGTFSRTTAQTVMLEIDRVAVLLDTVEQLPLWLSGKEIEKLFSFKLDKRKHEWLAGRICAKLATINLEQAGNQSHCAEIIICNDPSGKPYVTASQRYQIPPRGDISITHSGNFAAALAAKNRCGIDIQERKDTLLRVKARFCSSMDAKVLTELFGNQDELTPLNLLWAAKEAVRKSAGQENVPEFLDICLKHIQRPIESPYYTFIFSLHEKTVKAISGPLGNYALAASIIEEA